MDGTELARRIERIALQYAFNASEIQESAHAADVRQFANEIARHAAALVELLCDKPLDGSGRLPGPICDGAYEALFSMGTPQALLPSGGVPPLTASGSIALSDLRDDGIYRAIDSAVRGTALLHHTARHIIERLDDSAADLPSKGGGPKKQHIRVFVRALAALYSEAFAVPRKRHPSHASQEVKFCLLVRDLLLHRDPRLQVRRGNRKPRPPGPLYDLAALNEWKAPDYLRPSNHRKNP